jgi:hypothetical protein
MVGEEYPGGSETQIRHDCDNCMLFYVEVLVGIEGEVPETEDPECLHRQGKGQQHLSVVVLGGFGCYVSCPNAVSSRVIRLVFHRLQHKCFSSLDSINMVYQHPSSA